MMEMVRQGLLALNLKLLRHVLFAERHCRGEEACSECSAILPRHILGAVVGRWLPTAGLRARAAAPQVSVR